MAQPVINFPQAISAANPDGTKIVAAGDYYFNVKQGAPTSFVLDGAFSGATVMLYRYIPALDGIQVCAGGVWTDVAEDTITSPCATMMMRVTGTPTICATIRTKNVTVHPS